MDESPRSPGSCACCGGGVTAPTRRPRPSIILRCSELAKKGRWAEKVSSRSPQDGPSLRLHELTACGRFHSVDVRLLPGI